jgi:hypothetical protein
MRSPSYPFLVCLFLATAHAETRQVVKVSAEISWGDTVLATPRIQVALGDEANTDLPVADGATLTYSVKVTAASKAGCYLTRNAVSQTHGDQKSELKGMMMACDGEPVTLEMGPKMSATRRRLSVTVVPVSAR